MTAPALAPVDPDIAPTLADGERARAERYLRKLLAEGGNSPSRRRQLEHELRLIEGGSTTPRG